ncbi:PREDICTED: NACHT, LRR and PYD domains-containing protein 12-like [Acropora digitifera]|uniref:NACHT, LRR and PYD domains-containing protein 12-like n=1 Tax=Acropora digitifera TaxID=70779 RepID=UPI00077A1E2B|nr:PREDICTED: NACHT, LRR and PYD domains-containing protein 12-like [Acropora digitifera]
MYSAYTPTKHKRIISKYISFMSKAADRKASPRYVDIYNMRAGYFLTLNENSISSSFIVTGFAVGSKLVPFRGRSRPTKGRRAVTFCHTQFRGKDERLKCKMDCSVIKEAISPKTLNQFRFALLICWFVVGAILSGAFFEMEISEPRYDFRCNGKGDIDKDFVRGKCYDQYRIQNQKLGIPPYLFVLVNMSLIPIVTLIYSQCVKSTIYVNVAIHEGRAHHYFAKDLNRWQQLKKYPPNAKDCNFAKPEDILDKNHKNVLAVGRPGIGKTSLSIKMLRLWASGEAFNGDEHYKADFTVVFLVKFRRFNNNAKLSLRELLAGAETVQRLDDSVWEFVQNESTKVLLIFDGLDEYSRKEQINTKEDYKNDVEEKMPVSVLYKKLAEGKLLRGASILATTRPTAVKYVANVNFQRTVEICGFTSENVEEYVEKFTRDKPGAKEKIWQHIKSNMNLFSLSYIPVNCFLICHCLLKLTLFESSQALPTKMTDIYKMTVKMLLFNHMHNREGFSQSELEKLKSTHMYESFEMFPEELQKILNSLGDIAFKGIDEGRLLFESSEVSGLEDCGMLHKLPDLKPKAWNEPPKSQFCFTHLTIQEFFAAKHLVDTESNEGIEQFVRKHINDGTWQVVLQFAAGLLKNSKSDIFIKLLLKTTEKITNVECSERKTPTLWPAPEDGDLVVKVCKCLYEINGEQKPELLNKIMMEKIKFKGVSFSRCSLAPIDLAAVLHFLGNAEEVLYIDLSDNGLKDFGANEVKKFIVNSERKLKCLNLTGNNLTDKAAKDFAAALGHSNCKLESLVLDYNNFTDNAAKDLAAALKHINCKLKRLNLMGNNFTDKAANDLAAALRHSNCKLESLDLRYNKFTVETRQYLSDVGKQSNCKVGFEIAPLKTHERASKTIKKGSASKASTSLQRAKL